MSESNGYQNPFPTCYYQNLVNMHVKQDKIYIYMKFCFALETPEDKLNELQNSFSEWLLYENPEFATSINDRRYDDRLDDYSIEVFDRWKVDITYIAITCI